VLDDAFAGAGFAHDEAEPALLGVYPERFKDFLLMGQQGGSARGVKGVGFEAEV
jgi:hypothetical protein